MTRYYSILRPVGIGTFPKTQRVERIRNFVRRTYVPEIGREAWGYIEYENPITDEDARNYDLIREEKEMEYSYKEYKGYYIEQQDGMYLVSYDGDEVYFSTEKEAKHFIDLMA